MRPPPPASRRKTPSTRAGPSANWRAISRLPAGVGLLAMKSRIASRVGSPLRTRLAILSGRFRRLAGDRFLFGLGARGGLRLGAGGRFGLRRFGRFSRPGLGACRRLRLRRWFLAALALALLALGLLCLEQLDGGLERQALGLHRAGHGGEQPVMADIGS